MLGLTLQEEFRGKRLKGTAIDLSNDTNTGATQIAAKAFLEITYSTHDLPKGIEAVGPKQGRPVAVIGERGLGNPLDFARDWSGKHKRRLTSDLDQALALIGACFDGSGINNSDTLKNENFKPHVALKPLLEWLHKNGPDQASRNTASRAVSIYNGWAATRAVKPTQGSLVEEYAL